MLKVKVLGYIFLMNVLETKCDIHTRNTAFINGFNTCF